VVGLILLAPLFYGDMPWILSPDKSDRRLYVDMLFRKTAMFANYTPATYLDLGDYGVVTQEGEFIKSGNILKEYAGLVDQVGVRKEGFGSNIHFFASRSRSIEDTYCTITP